MENRNHKQVNKIPFKFDSRYVFSDTLTRMLRIVGEDKGVENLVMSSKLPYVFTKDPVPLIFNFSLVEAIIRDPYAKCSWLLSNREIQSSILITFDLTENTIEKTILVIFEMEIVNRELIPEEYHNKIKYAFPDICIEMIKNLERQLEEDNKDIYHYESKIFNYSREKIWDIITNFHVLMSKEKVITNCSIMTPVTKEGIEISFFVPEKKKFCKLKINKYKKDEKNNKWILGSLPLCGPFAHSENYWTLIKLGDNETLVSNTSKYIEQNSPEITKKLSEEKIRTFITIENFLKNSDNNKQKDINSIHNKNESEDKKKK